jgi:hypothetical protein
MLFGAFGWISNEKRAAGSGYPSIETRSEFLDAGRLLRIYLGSASALAIVRQLRCRPSLPAICLTLCKSSRKGDARRGLICCNLQDCSHTTANVEVRRCP